MCIFVFLTIFISHTYGGVIYGWQMVRSCFFLFFMAQVTANCTHTHTLTDKQKMSTFSFFILNLSAICCTVHTILLLFKEKNREKDSRHVLTRRFWIHLHNPPKSNRKRGFLKMFFRRLRGGSDNNKQGLQHQAHPEHLWQPFLPCPNVFLFGLFFLPKKH